MRRLAWIACLAALSGSCGDDSDSVCGIGNWVLAINVGAGDCFPPGTMGSTTLNVSAAGDVSMVNDPIAVFTGSLSSGADGCSMSGSFATSGTKPGTDPPVTYTETDSMDLVESGGTISGTGSFAVSFSDGTSCSQVITFLGAIQ